MIPAPKSGVQALLHLRTEWNRAHQAHHSKDCDRIWAGAVGIAETVLRESDPALLERIPASLNERLARDGREWERLIVQVAASENATFGSVEFEIEVSEASKFHQWLEFEITTLNGGILFTESASLEAYRDGRWSGRTYCFFPENCRNWTLTPLESLKGLTSPPRLAKLLI